MNDRYNPRGKVDRLRLAIGHVDEAKQMLWALQFADSDLPNPEVIALANGLLESAFTMLQPVLGRAEGSR